MTIHENRDDIIRRMIDQKQTTERRMLSSKEIQEIYEYVVKEVMPRIYSEEQE